MNDDIIKNLIKEHTQLLENICDFEIIPEDDPDLIRMEEIMKKIKELKEKDNSSTS